MSIVEFEVTLGTVQVRGISIVIEKAVYYITTFFNKFWLQNLVNHFNFHLEFKPIKNKETAPKSRKEKVKIFKITYELA